MELDELKRLDRGGEAMNEVFTIRDGEWQVRLGREVLPTIWNSRGAALAGMKVEMRRRGIHEDSRDCWCGPEVLADLAALKEADTEHSTPPSSRSRSASRERAVSKDRTHFEGCYDSHHECAIVMVDTLRAENARLRAALEAAPFVPHPHFVGYYDEWYKTTRREALSAD